MTLNQETRCKLIMTFGDFYLISILLYDFWGCKFFFLAPPATMGVICNCEKRHRESSISVVIFAQKWSPHRWSLFGKGTPVRKFMAKGRGVSELSYFPPSLFPNWSWFPIPNFVDDAFPSMPRYAGGWHLPGTICLRHLHLSSLLLSDDKK